MMQNFRARSDVLVGQFEDEDEVQHSISDTSDSEQEEKIGREKRTTAAKYVCGEGEAEGAGRGDPC
jgi:hypothetical protein